ncbi:hypothetical protein [Streptomyces sp. SD15]
MRTARQQPWEIGVREEVQRVLLDRLRAAVGQTDGYAEPGTPDYDAVVLLDMTAQESSSRTEATALANTPDETSSA